MAGSIVDYTTLQTAIANWMMRSGNTDLQSNIPDFIAFCEDAINYGLEDPEFPIPPLRVKQMEIASTTMTFIASTNSIVLPGDYLEMRRLYVSGSPIQKLTFVTPNQMDSSLANYPNGPPEEFYTVQNNSIVLASPVNTSMSVVMGYYQMLPGLSATNTSNWLLNARPAVYLSGSLFFGFRFLGDSEMDEAKWARQFSAAIRAMMKQDTKARFSGDALQMKTDTGNP